MSDLIAKIQAAQRDAGEAAVIADLEARGLAKPSGLVPIEEHNRLTAGPAPWTTTRISEEAFQLARSVFGASSEDDDKRIYRTMQAYEWRRS